MREAAEHIFIGKLHRLRLRERGAGYPLNLHHNVFLVENGRELLAEYDIALTLDAIGRVATLRGGVPDPAGELERGAILERLGVITVPEVPLPVPAL